MLFFFSPYGTLCTEDECYFGARDGSGWAYKVHDCGNWPTPPGWTLLRLLQDPEFARELCLRYYSLRNTILSESYINSYIDSVHTLVQDAQIRHYQKWRILGINVGTPDTDEQPSTYAGEIIKFKEWIATRLTWLDAHINLELSTGKKDRSVPDRFLLGNYPNPFNNISRIFYTLPVENLVCLKIYNMLGRNVGTLVEKRQPAGDYSVTFDASGLSSGIYFCRLRAGQNLVATHKMILLR
ncbi:T9SS type A sorting domain-containing protein [candidate division KSB1 bacterium]|nr:T9SS type A sorting domain-containing protein [candidate division KSB1 bacterium]